MPKTSYAIALGSNRRHGTHGSPRDVIRAAAAELVRQGFTVEALSTIRTTPALGPAGRSFANAVLLLVTDLEPPDLLERLQAVERSYGRRSGRRWGPRVLDLDIILWSGGPWEEPRLIVPHPEMRRRMFVLEPLAQLFPGWRDPITGATVRQLHARLAAPRPVDRTAARS